MIVKGLPRYKKLKQQASRCKQVFYAYTVPGRHKYVAFPILVNKCDYVERTAITSKIDKERVKLR